MEVGLTFRVDLPREEDWRKRRSGGNPLGGRVGPSDSTVAVAVSGNVSFARRSHSVSGADLTSGDLACSKAVRVALL